MKKSLVSIFLALFCYAAIAAFITPSIQLKPSARSASFNIEQDKIAQDKNVEAAKRFVGVWKGKLPNMPTDLPPNTNIDVVLFFKMEGDRLKGTVRAFGIRRNNGEAPQIVRDEYAPLPDLNVEGKTITWKDKWILPDYERLSQGTLINDDEILYEFVGTERIGAPPTLLKPISYKLKREK